jgi:hypothetical protein
MAEGTGGVCNFAGAITSAGKPEIMEGTCGSRERSARWTRGAGDIGLTLNHLRLITVSTYCRPPS